MHTHLLTWDIANEKSDFGILTIIDLKENFSYPIYFRKNNYINQIITIIVKKLCFSFCVAFFL